MAPCSLRGTIWRPILNKRDFLKSTAALAAAPAILSRTKLAAASIAERQALRETRKAKGPTPTYVYDSDKHTMTFWRADTGTRNAFAYMMAA